MTCSSNERETASALLLSVALTLILFGIIAAMVISSTTTSRAVTESSDQLAALYVAQSGLALAKQEIAETMDADDDGLLGTVAGETLGGSYQVLATDLGNNLRQLDAVGTFRTGSSNLREIVEVTPSLKFPKGAMSILGTADTTKLQLKKDFGLVLDGGDSAALSITDPTLFDGIAKEFVAALASGRLPPDNLTGAVTAPMDINGITEDVPIVNVPEYDAGLENLDTFYDELIAGVGSLIPTAKNVVGLVTWADTAPVRAAGAVGRLHHGVRRAHRRGD